MFTSKELYLMNGGNKLYIYKDGFGDIYSATAAEETEWANIVIADSIQRVTNEENPVNLQFAIQNLQFHNYAGLTELLNKSLENASMTRTTVIKDFLSGITMY